MKLNQQLRLRLIQQTKAARQTLVQTLRQKEKLVQRLEISAKDFQSDVLPLRVFDFIAHERRIQAKGELHAQKRQKKALAKSYADRSKPYPNSSCRVRPSNEGD